MNTTSKQEAIRDEKGRFVPGVSRITGGRPKKPITGWLIKILEEELPDGMSRAEFIARKLTALAAQDGDLNAIKEVIDRTEGKAQQKIDHTTMGEKMPAPIYGGTSRKKV